MKRQVETLSQTLLEKIHTTQTLKRVSDTLEELSQNPNFKEHTSAIVGDTSLTKIQKVTQLLHVIKGVELPLLYDFFKNNLNENSLWIFEHDQINYFDKFVQAFQMTTEDIEVLTLATAIELKPDDLIDYAKDLSETFKQKVVIHHQVKPEILGGAQVKFQNIMFDFSLHTKLQQFEREWLESLKEVDDKVDRHALPE